MTTDSDPFLIDKTVTLAQFQDLPLEDRLYMAFAEGIRIAQVEDEKSKLTVFEVQDFFVQVSIDLQTGKVRYLKAMMHFDIGEFKKDSTRR